MPRSLTLSSTSMVPEESFPPPVAAKFPANTQSAAADHLRPRTNSQAPQPVRADRSRATEWLRLPGMFQSPPARAPRLLNKAQAEGPGPLRETWGAPRKPWMSEQCVRSTHMPPVFAFPPCMRTTCKNVKKHATDSFLHCFSFLFFFFCQHSKRFLTLHVCDLRVKHLRGMCAP